MHVCVRLLSQGSPINVDLDAIFAAFEWVDRPVCLAQSTQVLCSSLRHLLRLWLRKVSSLGVVEFVVSRHCNPIVPFLTLG